MNVENVKNSSGFLNIIYTFWSDYEHWLGFLILFGVVVIRISERNIVSRKKLVNETISLLKSATNSIVMFGGDLTWIDDYFDVLRKLRQESQRIEIYSSKQKVNNMNNEALKKFNNSVKKLSTIDIKVRLTDKDTDLRCTIINVDKGADAVFLFSRRAYTHKEKTKYTFELFSRDENKIFADIILDKYKSVKKNSIIYEPNKK